jgi:hypothetical protein
MLIKRRGYVAWAETHDMIVGSGESELMWKKTTITHFKAI